MKKTGLAWHVHHDKLVEWCFDYDERVAYIKSDKPKSEQATRLRLFQFVRNPPAPVGEAGKAYDEAGKTRDEAWKAYGEAWQACGEVWQAYVEAGKTRDEAGKAYDEAWKACDEAGKACDEAGKAYDEALTKATPTLVELHAVECPDCPWDGTTILVAEKAKL